MKGTPPLPSTQTHPNALSATASRLLTKATAALGHMQLGDAERALLGVLALAPECSEANRLMGVVSQMRGDYARAVDFLQDALVYNPADATTHMNLGSALYEAGATEAAFVSLQRACELAPNMAASWYNLGKALKLQCHYVAAREALSHALTVDSTHVLSRLCLADVQTGLGDIVEAARNYREVLRRQPANASVWFSLANLKTERLEPADVVRLQHALRQANTTTDARILLGFALAKALEDQSDYAAAFAALQRANALKRHTVVWHADAERTQANAIMRAFTGPMPTQPDPTLGKEVIFIVSLPRSGSTLTEQILASHPNVEGANEITDLPQVIEDESKRRGMSFPQWVSEATAEDWARLGREYLARTEHWRKERPRVTDKNLVTWQLVGAIMAMLPGARIVDCHRDPLETCFACYRQLFSNGAYFSYDLTDMASHYQDYDRLRRFWHERFPQRILDYPYEALLADPEARIRWLLEFCGLEFDATCLTPHLTTRIVRSTPSAAQVRQPLRPAVPYSTLYSKQLELLRAQIHATFAQACNISS